MFRYVTLLAILMPPMPRPAILINVIDSEHPFVVTMCHYNLSDLPCMSSNYSLVDEFETT